ncbi:MAG: transaldolase family protein, partial [Acidobacteriaceae bacterium]
QVSQVAEALAPGIPAIVSVFAGRIADTGVDPVPLMAEAKRMLRNRPLARLLWASPRELLNIFQADEAGCDIITVPPEILRKLSLVGKDLGAYSLETVEMFHCDAAASAFQINTRVLVAARSVLVAREDDLNRLGEIPHQVIRSGSAVGPGGHSA